jgi:hypothetical protein
MKSKKNKKNDNVNYLDKTLYISTDKDAMYHIYECGTIAESSDNRETIKVKLHGNNTAINYNQINALIKLYEQLKNKGVIRIAIENNYQGIKIDLNYLKMKYNLK